MSLVFEYSDGLKGFGLGFFLQLLKLLKAIIVGLLLLLVRYGILVLRKHLFSDWLGMEAVSGLLFDYQWKFYTH